MSETFDTLAAAQTLRNKGMDSGHAEGVVEVVRNAQSELATKADIEGVKADIKSVNDRIDSLGESLRTEMTALGQELKAEMKALSQEMKTEMKVLGSRIDTTNGRIDTTNGRIDITNSHINTMRWLIGLNFTATMAAIAAIVVVAITLAAQ